MVDSSKVHPLKIMRTKEQHACFDVASSRGNISSGIISRPLPDSVDPFVPRFCTAGTFFFFSAHLHETIVVQCPSCVGPG
jgi:hypothetical protein